MKKQNLSQLIHFLASSLCFRVLLHPWPLARLPPFLALFPSATLTEIMGKSQACSKRKSSKAGASSREPPSSTVHPKASLQSDESLDPIRILDEGSHASLSSALRPVQKCLHQGKVVGELVMFFSFLVNGLLPPFSEFFLMALEEYGV
jgi:hypothetical protein